MHSILARRLESEILLCIGSKTKFKVDSLFITCRFCYEVAALSWWEKKMAATLFAEVPTTSMVHAFQIDIDMYWKESVRRHVSLCVCLGRSPGSFRERRAAETGRLEGEPAVPRKEPRSVGRGRGGHRMARTGRGHAGQKSRCKNTTNLLNVTKG